MLPSLVSFLFFVWSTFLFVNFNHSSFIVRNNIINTMMLRNFEGSRNELLVSIQSFFGVKIKAHQTFPSANVLFLFRNILFYSTVLRFDQKPLFWFNFRSTLISIWVTIAWEGWGSDYSLQFICHMPPSPTQNIKSPSLFLWLFSWLFNVHINTHTKAHVTRRTSIKQACQLR